jgi:hypothetical protein
MKDWLFPAHSVSEDIVQALIDWCRETAGLCRRPFGIDGFDLTIAAGKPERVLSRVCYDRLKPIAFYETTLSARIIGLLAVVEREFRIGEDVRLSAALFSWGDAAHAALPPTT